MSLQRRRVNKEEEDKVILTGSKNGKFSSKALYSALKLGSTTLFPTSVFWNSWVPPKVGFFCLGGYLDNGFNFGSFKEEGMILGK